MGHRKVIQSYYGDINNLTELLNKYVNSYRLLIGGVGELNAIALAKKSDVKDGLKRVHELGEIIDEVIEVLEDVNYNYINYCKLKSEVIKCKMEVQYIETEIDEELKLKE